MLLININSNTNNTENELKITEAHLTKSKKDNIYQVYIGLNRRFGWVDEISCVTNDNDSSDDSQYMDLSFGDCSENESDEPSWKIKCQLNTDVLNKAFEYADYTISKGKDCVTITFFEYPFEDDDLISIDEQIIK